MDKEPSNKDQQLDAEPDEHKSQVSKKISSPSPSKKGSVSVKQNPDPSRKEKSNQEIAEKV